MSEDSNVFDQSINISKKQLLKHQVKVPVLKIVNMRSTQTNFDFHAHTIHTTPSPLSPISKPNRSLVSPDRESKNRAGTMLSCEATLDSTSV